jgi:hypothetical protein
MVPHQNLSELGGTKLLIRVLLIYQILRYLFTNLKLFILLYVTEIRAVVRRAPAAGLIAMEIQGQTPTQAFSRGHRTAPTCNGGLVGSY